MKSNPTRRTNGLLALVCAFAFAVACSLSACASPAATTQDEGSSHVGQTSGTEESASFRDTDLGCDLTRTGSVDLAYAKNFTIDTYEGGYQLVCTANGERFLIVPENSPVPEDLASGIAVIQQPVTSTYLVSTGMICLLDEIDALDAVTVSSVTAQDCPVEHLAQAIDAGDVAYGGKYSSPDFELIANSGCTLAIENTKINHAPDAKQKLQELGVTVITEQSSTEPQVLGRLEWIKLMGAIFGHEEQAQASFDAIAARVESVASQDPTGTTVTFFYINDDGAAVTRRSTDYFSQMIELAGGSFVSFDPDDENEEQSSSVQAVIDLEAFYATAKESDVIIYNTTVDASVTSIEDLIAKNPLLADFKAVQEGRVYACDENMYQAMTSMDAILIDIRAALTNSGDSSGYIWKLD